MKIAQVTFNFPPEIGGIGQYVWNLSKHLARMGEEVTVIAPAVSGRHKDESTDFRVRRVGAFRFLFVDPVPLNMLSVLQKLDANEHFDVVHLHGHLYLFSFFGALISRFLKVPYVITFHGEGLPMSSLSRMYKFLRDNTEATYTLQHARKVISVNRFEVDALVSRYKVPYRKITVIPNGVDEKRFSAASLSDGNLSEFTDKKIILSGGVLAKWKGLDYLINAMKLVAKSRDDVRLVITGGGPEEVRLKSLTASLKLGEYVKFLGSVKGDEIPQLHRSSYMYVLPSIYDVCPTSVLEAMASENPVVVTSNGGQKELVINGESGLVVASLDAEALANAILTLLSDETLAHLMGKRGRQLVLEKFTWDTVCRKIREVYDTVTCG